MSTTELFTKIVKRNVLRSKFWCFVLYPDSAPEDWKTFLNDLCKTDLLLNNVCCSAVISPLHDNDVSKDGTFKKPHYHIMLVFDCFVEYATVLSIILVLSHSFPSISHTILYNPSSYLSYMVHEGFPEEFQYSYNDIEVIGRLKLSDIKYEENKR